MVEAWGMGRDVSGGHSKNWPQNQPSIVTHWPDLSSFDGLQNKNFRNIHLKPSKFLFYRADFFNGRKSFLMEGFFKREKYEAPDNFIF